MTIGTSIFLIAAGAILRYATHFNIQSVDEHEVGLILMVVGVAGLVLSLLYTFVLASSYRRDRYAGSPDHTTRY
jgi:hypothetical protein